MTSLSLYKHFRYTLHNIKWSAEDEKDDSNDSFFKHHRKGYFEAFSTNELLHNNSNDNGVKIVKLPSLKT